jgi:hypothetical protein
MWKTLVAQSFKEAKKEATHLGVALDARSKGLIVSQAESLSNASRTPIKSAAEIYLEQNSGNAIKTVFQHRLTYAMSTQLKRWNMDYLSLRADPPAEPMQE